MNHTRLRQGYWRMAKTEDEDENEEETAWGKAWAGRRKALLFDF